MYIERGYFQSLSISSFVDVPSSFRIGDFSNAVSIFSKNNDDIFAYINYAQRSSRWQLNKVMQSSSKFKVCDNGDVHGSFREKIYYWWK